MPETHPQGLPTHTPRHEAPKPGKVANILAIAGLIILAIIVIWGLLHIASLSSSWFSDLFNGKKDTSITVDAPATTVAGNPMTISWKYNTDTKGTFAILYECANGLQMGIPGPNHTLSPLPCGAAFTVGNASSSNSAVIVPLLSGTTSSANTVVSVIYLPSAAGTTGPEARGSANVSINRNGQVPTPVASTTTTPATGTSNGSNTGTTVTPKPTSGSTTPKPTTGSTGTKPKPQYSGPADLVVSMVSLTTDASGLSVATFDIKNIGGSPTGMYYFQATLPTAQPYTFTSQPQASLTPGSHIVNTLRFSQTVSGQFTVIVDPSNTVREISEGNNQVSQWIQGGSYQQYQQQYQQYPYGYGY